MEDKKSFTELIKRPAFKSKPGCTKEQIKMQEEALGLTLPKEYASFLEHTNGGELCNGEIVLFSVFDPRYKINIRETIGFANRPDNQRGGCPKEALIIGCYNFGDPVCYDVKTNRIFQWDNDNCCKFLEYPTFNNFLDEVINELK